MSNTEKKAQMSSTNELRRELGTAYEPHADLAISSGVSGECEEGKWAECRQDLVQAIFNQSTVPSRKPDYILEVATEGWWQVALGQQDL
eukprot:gene7346-25691_t